MEFVIYLKAIISRLLFVGHGIVSVYIYWEYQVNRGRIREEDKYEFFYCTPLFFIFVEAAITLGYRKGIEYKYFWPSGFLYITCLVPIIWLIELDMFEQRISSGGGGGGGGGGGVTTTFGNDTAEQERGVRYLNAKVISNKGIKKVSELGVVLGVIIGRWLIPRGTLTRDQLSALLLGYVSNSADILELFSTFEEQEVFDKRDATIGVMVVFTISMYQFPLTTTATMETDDSNESKNNKVRPATYSEQLRLQNGGRLNGITDVKIGRTTLQSSSHKRNHGGKRSISQPPLRKVIRPSVRPTISEDVITPPKRTLRTWLNRPEPKAINEDQTEEKEKSMFQCRKLHGEAFQILVTLLMQDGPFLILRLYLLIKYEVASELHVFFTCKNAIVSILLVYRLLVLSCSEDEEDEEFSLHRMEAENKLRNIQRALENMTLKDIEPTNMYVK